MPVFISLEEDDEPDEESDGIISRYWNDTKLGNNRQPKPRSEGPAPPTPEPDPPPTVETCTVIEYVSQWTEWEYKEDWKIIRTVIDVAVRIMSFGLVKLHEERVVEHYRRHRNAVRRWKEDSCQPGVLIDDNTEYGDWTEWKYYSPSGETAPDRGAWFQQTEAGRTYQREAPGAIKAGVEIKGKGDDVYVFGRNLYKRASQEQPRPTDSNPTSSVESQTASERNDHSGDQVPIFVTGFQQSDQDQFNQGANFYSNKAGSKNTDWSKVYSLDPLIGKEFTGEEINTMFRHGDTLNTHDFDFRDINPQKKYRIKSIDYGSSTLYRDRVYTNPTKDGKVIKGNYARYRIILETMELGR